MGQGQELYSQLIGGDPSLKSWKHDGWAKGQNTFSEDNEIRPDEFYDGVNIELTGRSSIRLPRRGSRLFTSIPGLTEHNGWGVFKNPVSGVNLLLTMIDGRLFKTTPAGVSSEVDNTKTWNTLAKMRGVQLRDSFYFGNGVDAMSKTNGSTITQWSTVTAVTGVGVVKTGAGTDTLYEYGVTAVTDVGETEISTVVSIFGPATLDASNYMTITWNRKTNSNVKGYNIYKSYKASSRTLMTFIDQQASGATQSLQDKGNFARSLIYVAPTFNTTGGVKGNIFAQYANTLFVAGNDDQPDTVYYGGTSDKYESFNPSDNGGWIIPGRGDGERVTGMIGFDDYLVIFKQNSIWKFIFAGDGGPQLTAIIPQYGSSSVDTITRMEKDLIFLGSDGRYRIFGYEPTQLNVVRTTDISNRIQPQLDALDMSNLGAFFAVFYDQKFILCNGSEAYPYDRRYTGFLGKWTNYLYDSLITWDQGGGQPKLFGMRKDTGQIWKLLVPDTYDDNGLTIQASFRPKTVDGGEDSILKYFGHNRYKLKSPRGTIQFEAYRDGGILITADSHSFTAAVPGMEAFEWGEPMWGEENSETAELTPMAIIKQLIEEEAYSMYVKVKVNGNAQNNVILQSMNGTLEVEDVEHFRDEILID